MKGVVVGGDKEVGWLLPWWFKKFRESNTLPVAFIDFGMDSQMLGFCRERGEVFSLEGTTKAPSSKKLREWESSYGSSYQTVWQSWMKKPAGCLLSPFEESIWIDLDCEVLVNIEEIFRFLEQGELAVSYDKRGSCQVNSGVIVFRKGSHIIDSWAKEIKENGEKYWGDDRALAAVIARDGRKFIELPLEYNWRLSQGVPIEAKIIHFCGEWGKNYIKTYGGMKNLLEESSVLQRVFKLDQSFDMK